MGNQSLQSSFKDLGEALLRHTSSLRSFHLDLYGWKMRDECMERVTMALMESTKLRDLRINLNQGQLSQKCVALWGKCIASSTSLQTMQLELKCGGYNDISPIADALAPLHSLEALEVTTGKNSEVVIDAAKQLESHALKMLKVNYQLQPLK